MSYAHGDLTEKIIGEAYYVFNQLGSGYLEKVYENALVHRLRKLPLKVEQQFPIPVHFDGILVGDYLADVLVEGCVLIELKALTALQIAHEVQIVNYLKATQVEVGLLINFGPRIEVRRKILSRS